MIRVGVAEGHTLLRLGLMRLLREVRGVIAAGEARDGIEAVELATKKELDVVLMNLALPKKDGIDVTREIVTHTKAKLLVFSGGEGQDNVLRALRAGAHGCIDREAGAAELTEAVEMVSREGRYIPPQLARVLAEQFLTPRRRGVTDGLSDREYQVLTMLASGMTTRQVAERLHLSEKTISTHRARVLEKLTLRNNAEITLFAVRNGLIDA